MATKQTRGFRKARACAKKCKGQTIGKYRKCLKKCLGSSSRKRKSASKRKVRCYRGSCKSMICRKTASGRRCYYRRVKSRRRR